MLNISVISHCDKAVIGDENIRFNMVENWDIFNIVLSFEIEWKHMKNNRLMSDVEMYVL